MKFNHIEISEDKHVMNIYLNRPEVHNAFNQEMIKELLDVFDHMNDYRNCRLVIIRGKGKSFSSGADLNYMRDQAEMSKEENLNDAIQLARLFFSIFMCNKPVITVAHGNVAGGANGIVAASDYAIASDDTIFRFSEVRLGLVPATISPYVVERIGRARAAELLLSGRSFSGRDAERYFLVNSSVPVAQLENEILRITEEFLKAAPGASAETKKLIRSLSENNINEKILESTARIIASARASEEGKEGIKSFFESRKANWLNESLQ